MTESRRRGSAHTPSAPLQEHRLVESVSESDEDIRRRLAAHRRTGDLDVLWPDLTGEERREAMGRIRSVVESVLRSASAPRLLVARDRHETRALGVAAFTAGMGPLLGWWIEEGRVEASPAARELLGLHLEHGRRRSALLTSEASRIAGALRSAGLRPILLKGSHTANEFFPHPCTRPAADIDLLVPAAGYARAAMVLSQLGFSESGRTAYAAGTDWHPPGGPPKIRSVELDHADNPWNVDLHRTLERWYFRGARRDLGPDVFDTDRSVDVAGQRVHVLDQPYLTAFLALHAACDLATVRMIRLVELILVIRADSASGRLDWRELRALLDRTDTGRFAYPALALTEDLAPDTVDRELMDRLAGSASRRMRRVLETIRRAEMGPLHERTLAVKLAWAVGAREVLSSLSDVVLPSDDGAPDLGTTLMRRLSIARWRITRRLQGSRGSARPDAAVPAVDGDGERAT